MIVYYCLTMYEWNTGAEQTGVSSINEPIMIISNAFLHNHEARVDTYFWETPVCRKNWDATRMSSGVHRHAGLAAAPEVPHDEAPFGSSTSCSDCDDEDLRSLAPELRQRRGRGGEGVALREVGGEKRLRWEIWAAASCGAQAAASCVTQSQY